MANRSFSYEEAFGPSPSKPKSNTPVEKQTFSYEDAFSPPAESRSRSIGAALNDTVIEVANAAAGGLSSAANFLLPGNSLSKFVDKNIVEDGESTQSVLIKAEKQKFRTEMENAKGVGDEVAAIGNYVVNTPALAAGQAVGSFVVPGAAVKGGGALARGLGAGANAVPAQLDTQRMEEAAGLPASVGEQDTSGSLSSMMARLQCQRANRESAHGTGSACWLAAALAQTADLFESSSCQAAAWIPGACVMPCTCMNWAQALESTSTGYRDSSSRPAMHQLKRRNAWGECSARPTALPNKVQMLMLG